jgi:hypothetical protein
MNAARLRFAHGAWLLSADLRGSPRLPSERLARHQIAAHRTWGVSGGLVVNLDGRTVVVHPGAAVDRCGRTGIVSHPLRVRLTSGLPLAVVLTVIGDGPRAAVRLREPGRLHELDVPLATVDLLGIVRTGDTHRQWLRRPGPSITIAGTVEKGAPVAGIQPGQGVGRITGWKAQVDLSAHRLTDFPIVVAGLAAEPVRTAWHDLSTGRNWQPDIEDTTVEVVNVFNAGFELVVRSFVTASLFPSGDVPRGTEPEGVRTAPFALTWLAVLPAERPEFPETEE